MLRFFVSVLLPTAAALFIQGCGAKAKKANPAASIANDAGSTSVATGTGGASAGFLTASDLELSGDIPDITAAQAIAQLADISVIYDNQPPTSKDCLDAVLDAVSVQGSDTQISVDKTLDYASCAQSLQTATTAATFKVSSATAQVYISFSCPKGGLAKYQNSTLQQLDPQAFHSCKESGTQMSEFKSTVVANYSGTGGSGTVTVTSIMWTAQPQFVPCSFANTSSVSTSSPNCVTGIVTSQVNQPSTGPAHTTLKVLFSTIKSAVASSTDSTSVWPSSGEIGIQLDAWKGSVLFSSNVTPPSYFLSSSVNGATASGKFPAPAAGNSAGTSGLSLQGVFGPAKMSYGHHYLLRALQAPPM